MGKKFLIINADDFGWSEGINRGILEAHTEGVLTSTTLIANGPATKDAIEIAKGTPSLGVGVHLNYHFGNPIVVGVFKKIFTKEGNPRYSLLGLWARCSIDREIRRELYLHFRSQVEYILEQGIKPTHLDTHKHIHIWPAVFDIVCKVANEFGIQAIRFPFENPRLSPGPINLKVRIPLMLLSAMTIFPDIYLANIKYKIYAPGCLVGITQTGYWTKKRFLNAIKYIGISSSIVKVVEIMVHPGYPEGLKETETRLIESRLKELKILKDKDIKHTIQTSGIELINFSNLPEIFT